MRKIVTLVYALVVTSCWAQEPINYSISYGACIMRDGSVIGINENKLFAMHSVMKFPQALYVADYLSRKGLALDDTIVINKADLMEATSISPFSPRTHLVLLAGSKRKNNEVLNPC